MEEQLEVSDVLVVNKLDLISVEDRDALKNQLNEVNKYSSKIYTTYGQVNIEELSQFRDQLVMTHTHSHHHGINSMQYTFTTAIDRQYVLRLKGYVQFKDEPNVTYEFQYSFGMPDYEVINGDYPLTIVLIGEQLDVNRLKNKLDVLQFS
ncbi:Cobalamin synthesis protein cobW C-terminal domain [Mycobacteroides abscessus subsp. massiliense]|nr:Cobalamin synthesis protein cobW C-terminal domain [Mycobacteroides abscessus subsp. massiliense]